MLSKNLRIMKTTLRFIPLVAVVVLAFSPFSKASDPEFVALAGWVNTPELNAKEGRSVHTILTEHKIENVAVGSAGMTLNVLKPQAAEARKLLAKAILNEGLRIVLYDEHGNMVSPETVLVQKKQ